MARRRPPTTISATHATTRLEEFRRGWSHARWADEAARIAASEPTPEPTPPPEIPRRANRSIPKGLQGRLSTTAPAKTQGRPRSTARAEQERVIGDALDEFLREAEL